MSINTLSANGTIILVLVELLVIEEPLPVGRGLLQS